MLRFFLLLFLGVVIFFSLDITPIHAASLFDVSDTLSTNRPSALTTLSSGVSPGDVQAKINSNGSIFLASDSATLWGGTPENLTVATVSGDRQTLFFTLQAIGSHTSGTPVATEVTAMHTIKFTTATAIPANGSIIISFPNAASSDTNPGTPSNSTFMFNGLGPINIQTINASCSWTLTQSAGGNSQLLCNVGSTINAGTQITMFVGCSSATLTACATQVPTLINPAKSATQGTADVWQVGIVSYSGLGGSGSILDSVVTKIGTIESSTVNAHIDPTFSLTVSGVPNNFNMSSVCTDHLVNQDKTNSGVDSTSTQVDLGTLLFTQVNLAAQKITVTSNAILGYTVTATSSGHLTNPNNGTYLLDAQGTPTDTNTPGPASITAGNNKFGIHPCDLGSQGKISSVWGTSQNLFANPSSAYPYTIVSSNSAPGSTGDTFYIEYAATPGGTTLPGTYKTTLTYVATTVF